MYKEEKTLGLFLFAFSITCLVTIELLLVCLLACLFALFIPRDAFS